MFDFTKLPLLLWFGVIIVAACVEAATPMLVSIWFALGGLAALVAAFFGATITVQTILFIFVSLGALALAHPLAKRLVDPHIIPTNADRLLGTVCLVTEEINNLHSTGEIYADGKSWSARSENGERIDADTCVEILRMEGVTVIVRICENNTAVLR